MAEQTTTKPNCYECKHRGTLPGTAHSCCRHPVLNKYKSPMEELAAFLVSVERVKAVISAVPELGVRGDNYGIKSGWFNWPYNFDPIWLEACNSFERP